VRHDTLMRPSPRCGIAVALLAIAAGCAHRAEPTTLTLGPARELLVRAEVNGRPATFQLDTGASTTSFAGHGPERFRLRGGWPTAGHGAGGELGRVAWVQVLKLEVAGETIRGLMAAVFGLDGAHGAIDGVLGMDVLGDYALEVDLRAMRAALHRDGDASFLAADLVAADYRPLPGGQVALTVAINGRPVTAVLDLGANRTFANPHTGLVADDDETTITAAIGADRKRLTFRAASNVAIDLGPLALQARSVWITDLPIFRTFGLADRPAVVLGTDVLAGRRIVVDPFRHRVYLSR
jgi:Aspartyl protease